MTQGSQSLMRPSAFLRKNSDWTSRRGGSQIKDSEANDFDFSESIISGPRRLLPATNLTEFSIAYAVYWYQYDIQIQGREHFL